MNIEIDFDVFKTLTSHRTSEAVSYNDVIRELLSLGKSNPSAISQQATKSNPSRQNQPNWSWKGVCLPVGTDIRARYKGKHYYGGVEAAGLKVGENVFGSPSAAAMSITHVNINGWTFWECRISGESDWKSMQSLRNQSNESLDNLLDGDILAKAY